MSPLEELKSYIYVDTLCGVPGHEIGLAGFVTNPISNLEDAETLKSKLAVLGVEVEIKECQH